jgi:uncharacterized protein (TIGR03437 family)
MGDRALSVFLSFFILTLGLAAQTPAAIRLTGHVNPRASAANDRGRAEASLQMDSMMLMLKPTAAQQADLDNLLKQQQDPGSPSFHQWLTPEQYADRFGATQSEIDGLTAWLKASNLSVASVARSRNEITFSGNVRDVESAFSTEIHRYNVGGESHFANATEPAVPAQFASLVQAIHGLHDFKLKARAKRSELAKYTSGSSGSRTLGPGDIAAIYDIKPLLDSGVSGKGQKLVIVGQTDILLSDIESFRSFFGLPANDPQIVLVPTSKDPGISSGDQDEANLDVEFSGAAARDATVIYVNSTDVTVSLTYAITQNLAPVISMSYGDCEYDTGNSGLATLQTLANQANAQGITWLAASGDSGAADCYEDNLRGNTGANLAVDAPGSVPGVTSVGGTEMNEGTGSYFAAANDATHTSVSTYIPEMVWNDSAVDGAPSSGGGGASLYFAKPSWQTGPGVPADGSRDVPDVSLDASDAHEPRLFYSAGELAAVGGTSVAAPTFAGIVALLNQYTKSVGQGNINPRLYAMAQSVPSAFHDIIVGNNIVNGCTGVRNCTVGSVGYNAGVGFDQASGLGSVDAFNLVTNWTVTSTTAKTPVSMTLTSATATTGFTFTASVTASSGTPTGTVSFFSGGASLGTATLSKGLATLTVATSALTLGFDSVSAEYSGDSTFASAGASVGLGVYSPSAMSIQGITNAASYQQGFSTGEILSIFGSLLAGSAQSAATVPLPTTLAGATVTINGTAAPIYYASPTQINAQIPYGNYCGQSGCIAAPVTVTYNGQTVTASIPIASYSPGIFIDSTGAPAGYQTAKRGQTIALYITGQGAVSPQPANGALPASGTTPIPQNTVNVTVGGVQAATPYAYIGMPAWAIGLTQVNFTIPNATPLGSQPVIVTVTGSQGTTISAPANITITN